jgi:DNA repair protein RadD
VLILVHRAELLDQASRANASAAWDHRSQPRYGPKPYGAGRQRANRSPEATPAAEGFLPALVVDEAHHTTAGTWAKVIAHFHAAKLLGVTATPIRGDGRGLR